MAFHVIEELPIKDQQELTRILAIDPTKRTTREVAFYNARAEYLDNRIIELDDDDNILHASGFIMPDDGQAGFAKGAQFIERNAAAGAAAVYENMGTIFACDFKKIGGSGGNVFGFTVGNYAEADRVLTGTNDEDVLNQAITDINTLSGGKIEVITNAYVQSAPLTMKSNVELTTRKRA